jgi:uncharacterized repeat protein (TIGR01451 family)
MHQRILFLNSNATILEIKSHILKKHLKIIFLLALFYIFFRVLNANTFAATYTVTNTNDSGAGSFRQALLDVTTNCVSGPHNISFSIPTSEPSAISNSTNGKVVSGSTTYYRISPLSELPAITCDGSTIDGTSQVANQGDLNPGQIGTGGTVGVDQLPLNKFEKPEIEINFSNLNSFSDGITFNSNANTIKGLAFYGKKTDTSTASVHITYSKSDNTVIQNIIGSTAAGTHPGSGMVNEYGVHDEGQNTLVQHNYFANSADGLLLDFAIGAQVLGNEFNNNNQTASSAIYGDSTENRATDLVKIEGNLITNTLHNPAVPPGTLISQGKGIEVDNSTNMQILNNTISYSSIAGIGIQNSSNNILIEKNIICDTTGVGLVSLGPGIYVKENAQLVHITENTLFDNDGLGIDLIPAQNNPDGVTVNDLNDSDTAANQTNNFPVIESATFSSDGTKLILSGFSRPNASIEFFVSDNDPTGFGEGKFFLKRLDEGSISDLENTTGIYGPTAINGFTQGTDNTNRFKFEIPISTLPSPYNLYSSLNLQKLTSTATDNLNNTSEFSASTTMSSIDLSLDKIVDNTHPANGENITYTISVKNNNLTPTAYNASNLKIKDLLPAEVTYQSYTASVGTYDHIFGIWNIGNLNAGSTESLNITVKVINNLNIINTAEIYAVDQKDNDSTPNNGITSEDDYGMVVINTPISPTTTQILTTTPFITNPASITPTPTSNTLVETGKSTIKISIITAFICFILVIFNRAIPRVFSLKNNK